jgi:ribosomal protein S3
VCPFNKIYAIFDRFERSLIKKVRKSIEMLCAAKPGMDEGRDNEKIKNISKQFESKKSQPYIRINIHTY